MKQLRTLLLPALYIFAVVAVVISPVSVSSQQGASGSSSPSDIVYAQPGQLVDAGGFRLNVYCIGNGSPAVVFDSGYEDWAPAWSTVQPKIAKWTRACSYDRAGAGFSEPGPMPRTSVRIAQELHTALHNAGIDGPYILVGSAFGGDNVRTFADLYMNEVAGMVMDDADFTDLEPKEMQQGDREGRDEFAARLRECGKAIAEHKPMPPLGSSPSDRGKTCAQQFFRGLPEKEWSPELNAKLLEIAQTKVAMYDAYASEMEQMTQDEIYLQQHRPSYGSRPIRVLTSRNHGLGHFEQKPADTPKHLKYEKEMTAAQARFLAQSSNSKQIFARHSSEYIQFDDPETLINAVRQVYDQSRSPIAASGASSTRASRTVFRDCSDCPEMVVLPAGSFTMGSSAEEKSWAASHGGSLGSVADEAPQHQVSLSSLALGKYDVTRGEYGAFVIAPVELSCRSGACGIFPLRLAGQPIRPVC